MDYIFSDDLSRKVSRGIAWVTIASVCSRGLNTISAVILARLLSPADFGLVALATAILSFTVGTTSTGFGSAIIQKQEKPEEFLDTAWSFELARYLVLFILIFFFAPVLARAFAEPLATNVIRLSSLSLLFAGTRNIGIIYFRKNLDFQKQFFYETIPLMCRIFTVIPLALLLRNVWALVYAGVIMSAVSSGLSYFLHPYRPRPDFDLQKARELFGFGKWILGTGFIGKIREHGLSMFIGKFLGTAALGYFNRGWTFSWLVFQEVFEVVWKVGYSTFSKLQSDVKRFRVTYIKSVKLLTFVALPISGWLFTFSEDAVHLILTDKWLPIVGLIRWFSVTAALQSVVVPSGIVFQAVGKPRIGTIIEAVGLFLVAFSVYPFMRSFGVTGVVYSLLFGTVCSAPLIMYKTIRIIEVNLTKMSASILIPVVNTVATFTLIYGIRAFNSTISGWSRFIELTLISVAAYLFLTFLFNRYFNYGIYGIIRERVVALR